MKSNQENDDDRGRCGAPVAKRSYTDILRDTPSSSDVWRDAEFIRYRPDSRAKPPSDAGVEPARQ